MVDFSYLFFKIRKHGSRFFKSLLLLTVFAAVIWASNKGIHSLFQDNKRYPLKKIIIHTNGSFNQTRLLRSVHIDPSLSLFEINCSQLAKEIKAKNSHIISCVVSRTLPSSLSITLKERIPIAWLDISQNNIHAHNPKKGLLLDAQGVVLSSHSFLYQDLRHLPSITIPQKLDSPPKEGTPIAIKGVLRSLSLLHSFEQHTAMREEWKPCLIQVKSKHFLEASSKDGVQSIFGYYEHPRQIQSLIIVREHIATSSRQAKRIDLIPQYNIPVQFVQESPPSLSPSHSSHLDQLEERSILNRL